MTISIAACHQTAYTLNGGWRWLRTTVNVGRYPLTACRIVRSGPDGPILNLPDTALNRTILIEVPGNVQRLKQDAFPQAEDWRYAQRAAFRWVFDNCYMANDFVDGTFILIPNDGCGL